MTVYDYSFARPDPAQLDEGVMRYLCRGNQRGKRLEAHELARLHAAGLKVGLVWENNTTDSDGGYQGGLTAGQEARRQATALGFPADVPIYWAVDRRLNNDQRAVAVEYGRGFRDGAGVSRPYGEAALVDAAVAAGLTDGGWVPRTWGRTANAVLIQEVTASPVSGTDANTVARPDWGGWHPNDPTIAVEDDDMPLNADDPVIKDIFTNFEILRGLRGDDQVGGKQVAPYQTYEAVQALAARIPASSDPKVIASAIADSLDKGLARKVADELAARLKA